MALLWGFFVSSLEVLFCQVCEQNFLIGRSHTTLVQVSVIRLFCKALLKGSFVRLFCRAFLNYSFVLCVNRTFL